MYEDGKSEDLEQHELESAMVLFKQDATEYLVKWRDHSYRDVDWVPGGYLLNDMHRKAQLKKYRETRQNLDKDGVNNVPDECTEMRKIIGEKREDGRQLHVRKRLINISQEKAFISCISCIVPIQ